MTSELTETLRTLLDLLIPDSADGSIPGAVRAGVDDALAQDAPVAAVLEKLERQASLSMGRTFAGLSAFDAAHFVTIHPQLWLECTRTIGPAVLRVYFKNPAVRAAMGLPGRPPFPDGYHMEAIDYDLLEPVAERGQIYRDPEPEDM